LPHGSRRGLSIPVHVCLKARVRAPQAVTAVIESAIIAWKEHVLSSADRDASVLGF
jgi:hypothetical protein